MATGNMKDIKRRIRSVGSTRQITKAMELVASSKLRRAKMRAESARPYFEAQYSLLSEIAAVKKDFTTPFTEERPVKRRLFIVIAGDRGLAGGYNSNVLKAAVAAHQDDAEKPKIIAVGRNFSRSAAMRSRDVIRIWPSASKPPIVRILPIS